MIGGNHRSNMELVGQGVANIFSSFFGGIPATGAIARTATNIKNGGRTPVAGMIHAVTLLLIVLFVGKWAALIPMATLAGVLVMVAYNMSEWENFISILKGPKGDAAVLCITFLLTVLIDLTVAIEIGMLLAVFLFMRTMVKFSDVSSFKKSMGDDAIEPETEDEISIPAEAEIFEITGPLFFGAAYKFKDAIKYIEKPPKVLLIRMRQVPIIDATGIKTINEVYKESMRRGTAIILSEVRSQQVLEQLQDSGMITLIGKENITGTLTEALDRCKVIAAEKT
jgi:SulP family sulfate permease